MPTIVFNISNGAAPFIAEVIGEGLPIQYIPSYGSYYFEVPECGEYTIRITDAMNCTKDITSICECTTTTTESSVTTTEEGTTTTTYETFPCNYPKFNKKTGEYFSGIYKTFRNYDLGTDLGQVDLEFNMFDIPAKIIVTFNGGDVIDTGYRGEASYQTALDAALTLLGEPTEVINPINEEELSFIKSVADEIALMTIYTPIDGAIIAHKLTCPHAIDTTTTTTEEATTTTEEQTTTTTPFSIPWNLLSDLIVDTGTIITGDYQTTWVDNNTYVDAQEASATPGFVVALFFGEYEDVPIDLPLSVNIKGWYEGNPAHNVKLQVYNDTTLLWENVTVDATDFPSGVAEQNYNFDLPTPTSSYVADSGILKMRIVHTSAGTASHNLYIDYVSLSQVEATTTTTEETTTTTI